MKSGWGICFFLWAIWINFSPILGRDFDPCDDALSRLSDFERNQLGKPKILQSGEKSQFRYTTIAEWIRLRRILLVRSLDSNPRLNLDLTAYTPGETLNLMKNRTVRNWH